MNLETLKKNLPMVAIVILAIAVIVYLVSGMGGNSSTNTTNSSSTTSNSSKLATNSQVVKSSLTTSVSDATVGSETSNLSATTAIVSTQASISTSIKGENVNTSNTVAVTTSNLIAGKTYTMEDVSTNADETSCWVVYKNSVYDVTSFITKHPGREAILQGCGKDLVEYNEAHPGGAFDSPTVLSNLTPLKIGELIKE